MWSAILVPTWWAPNGFAAIPTTALDPPHSAASPAVPALSGPGPQYSSRQAVCRNEQQLFRPRLIRPQPTSGIRPESLADAVRGSAPPAHYQVARRDSHL